MPRIMKTAVAPYRPPLPAPGTFGRLGDEAATIPQIIAAGYDPGAPGVTYTVDDGGNVIQNLTISAPAPSQPISSQSTASFPWPLMAVLALVGYGLFWGGKHS